MDKYLCPGLWLAGEFRLSIALKTTRNPGHKQFQILKLHKCYDGKELPGLSESGTLRILTFMAAVWSFAKFAP